MFCNHIAYKNVGSVLQKLYSNAHAKEIVFVKDSKQEDVITYTTLIHEAATLLSFLQKLGIKPGDELLLQIDDNKNFLIAFTSCLLGNIIAVPLAAGMQDEHKKKVKNVWQQMKTPFLLGDEETLNRLGKFFSADINDGADWWAKAQANIIKWPLLLSPSVNIKFYDKVDTDDLVYIQFSSGSTGSPKGVRVTHQNILYNTDSILNSSNSIPGETIVSWLPLSHDMGLVGCFLCGLLNDLKQVIIPTGLFIRNPLLWMDKVHKHRGNISFSPNFGYKYLLQEWENKKPVVDWDLSSLRIIYNGAEQISHEIINDFIAALKSQRLRDTCIVACYGLAEATLAVALQKAGTPARSIIVNRLKLSIGDAITLVDEGAQQSTALVCCGRAVQNVSIRICNQEHKPLGNRVVGMVEVKGQNITAGYYQHETSPITADGWLITGDIGFLDNDELYITGRHKEIIIINGINYYPYDIEKVLEANDQKTFALTKVAASSVFVKELNKEALIVFITSRLSGADFVPVAELARRVVMKHFGLVIADVVPVKRIPKTTSGKLQRTKLSAEYQEELQQKEPGFVASYPEEQTVVQLIHDEILKRYGLNDIDNNKPLIDLGFDSLRSTELISVLNKALQIKLSPTVVFEYATIAQLVKHISGIKSASQIQDAPIISNKPLTGFEAVAVIGMSCVFPGGANSPEQLWDILINGTNTVKEVPSERWNASEFYDSAYQTAGTSNTMYGSFIDNVQGFDAAFFGISPKEAESLDPQQRLLLEVSFQALQSARYSLQNVSGSNTGVYIGFSHSDYTQAHIHSGQPDRIDPYSLTGTISSTAAGRLSYFYNLSGPAMIIDTACSSSLVAIHNACRDLQFGDCNMALAGGVNLLLVPESYVALTKIQALSPDGTCKTFDGSANGYGRGEGCGMVVLKLLKNAVADGDPVLGVIRSSAVNHDGKSNGLTAPNGLAQQSLLKKAIALSELTAGRISYLEAHGTGTPLGDPLEIHAANTAYQSNGRKGKLLIGSIKSNIGHLESASGIAGFIKILLSMQHHRLPANLHFKQPNPLIAWNDIDIQVVDKNREWNTDGLLAAGISSFGFSGTNAHIIVEEAPAKHQGTTIKSHYALTLSAHSKPALKQMAAGLIQYLQNNMDVNTANLCYHLNCANNSFPYNGQTVISNNEELIKYLITLQSNDDEVFARHNNVQQPLAFQFTGQGSQYTGMGHELYKEYEAYRDALNECDKFYRKHHDNNSILSIIFEADEEKKIDQTQFTQPAIFCTGYALTKLFESFGIVPDIVLGHSVGEFIAICVAGIISLEDGIRLICSRAAFMQSLPAGGGMVSVMAPVSKVLDVIKKLNVSVTVAGINSPNQTVISGLLDELQVVKQHLQLQEFICVPLTVSHAFHSPLMQPIAAGLLDVVNDIPFNKPRIAVISNVTGQEFTKEQWNDPQYWVQHLLQPVQFVNSIKTLERMGCNLCVELGPQPVLTNLAKQTVPNADTFIFTLRKGQSAAAQFLKSLCNLKQRGVVVDWKMASGNTYHPYLQLPPYPFQRKKYWKELMIGKRVPSSSAPLALAIADNNILYDIQYEAIYKPYAADEIVHGSEIIIIYDQQSALANKLRLNYQDAGIKTAAYSINQLNDALPLVPKSIVCYIANVHATPNGSISYDDINNAFVLCKAIVAQTHLPQLIFLTNNVHASAQNTLVNFSNCLLWGFVTALKHEYAHLEISVADIDPNYNIGQLMSVISHAAELPLQLIITSDKWMAPRLKAAPKTTTKILFKNNCTYLLTGGFGSIGILLIKWMIQKGARSFVLVGRSEITSARTELVNAWEKQGCRIEYVKADVSNLHNLTSEFSKLNDMPPFAGIFHAAAVLNDKLLSSHDANSFTAAFDGKVQGAWNLHQLSLQWPLDHFVMFSSTASILGNPGQTNYAAANYFLNSLSSFRRAQQLPSLSICWGPWEGSNMITGLGDTFQSLGIQLLQPEIAFNALETALQQKTSGVVAAISMQPERFMANSPYWLHQFLPPEWQVAQTENNVAAEKVSFDTEDGALSMLEKLARAILQLEPDDVLNTQRPYFEIGFDSIMLSALQGKIRGYAGITVPISLFFQYPTLNSLAGYIMQSSLPKRPVAKNHEIINTYTISDELKQQVRRLSDDDITELLNQY